MRRHLTIVSRGSLKKRLPLVEEILFIQNLEKVRLPTATLLYLPDDGMEPPADSPLTTAVADKIQTGRQLEFKQKRYRKFARMSAGS